MWILLIILALIAASLLFGGFQKGTPHSAPAMIAGTSRLL